MKTKIFSAYGCDVYDECGILFVYFDSGESVGSGLVKARIETSDIELLQKSELDAYKVIIKLKGVRLTKIEEDELRNLI